MIPVPVLLTYINPHFSNVVKDVWLVIYKPNACFAKPKNAKIDNLQLKPYRTI